MSYADDFPVALVDTECDPPKVVTRFKDVAKAEWHLLYLAEHGGPSTGAKIKRGGYAIEGGRGADARNADL